MMIILISNFKFLPREFLWKNRERLLKVFILFISSILLISCTSAPRYHYSQPKTTNRTKPLPMLTRGAQHTAIFTASYYGHNDGFHGKKTANGEIFDKNALTAAHKTLPFGTVLKVTYLKTGKSVNVKINDRGPFIAGRDIDLSYGAAVKLGLVKYGVGKVRVTVVKWGAGETKHNE